MYKGYGNIFVSDFPHFVNASEIYLFVHKSLSRGFYLVCRLGSASKRLNVFVRRPFIGFVFWRILTWF